MKNIKVFHLFLSVIAVAFFGCTDETDDSFKLIKKVIETTARQNTQTFLYTYNGNQIVSIDGARQRTDFMYTDGLISRMVLQNKENQQVETIDYSYSQGKLVKVVSVGNYVMKYSPVNEKEVLVEKFTLSSGNVEVKEYHGTLQLSNGNLIKEERIYDNTPLGEESKYSISYDYDTKKNPFFNIEGYRELWNQNNKISVNNNVVSTMITSNAKDNHVVSSATTYNYAFTYDLDNYPKESISESAPLENGFVGYLKVEYFY